LTIDKIYDIIYLKELKMISIYTGRSEFHIDSKHTPFDVMVVDDQLDGQLLCSGYYMMTLDQSGYAEHLDKCTKLVTEKAHNEKPFIIFDVINVELYSSIFLGLNQLRWLLKYKHDIPKYLPMKVYGVAFIVYITSPEEKLFEKDKELTYLGHAGDKHKVYYLQY